MSYRIPQKRNLPSYHRPIHRSGGGRTGKRKAMEPDVWREILNMPMSERNEFQSGVKYRPKKKK